MQQIQTPENRDYKQNDDIETKEKKDRENKKQTEKLILTHRQTNTGTEMAGRDEKNSSV